jgi:hypothetical protein
MGTGFPGAFEVCFPLRLMTFGMVFYFIATFCVLHDPGAYHTKIIVVRAGMTINNPALKG